MPLKIDDKFEGKLTCAFKNDMRNLANFHPSTKKSPKFALLGLGFLFKFAHKFTSLNCHNITINL